MTKTLFLFYRIKIGIWLIGVKDFVAIHYCYEVFGVGEVDDVVSVAREHDDRLYLVAADFIVEDFGSGVVLVAELDESVTADYDELFPLGVVPMLTFGDAGLGDVDAYLSAVEGVDQFCERTSIIDVHL